MRAATWIAIYLLLVASPLLVLLLGSMPPGTEFWWDFSKALGFAGISMMGVQFALTARFKRATSPFGIDIIYFLHRYLAITALLLVLGHFSILWIAYYDELGTINPLLSPWYMTAGRAALILFTLAVVTSEFRKRLGLEYGMWRVSHVILASTGFVAGIAHIVGVGYYTQAPLSRALWLSMTLSWIALAIWVRLIKPARQKMRPFRVAEIRDEGCETHTVALEPVGHKGFDGFEPGQFAWLTLGASPFAVREHPFSISSTPKQLPRLEMTIRALGDFTNGIRDVPEGSTAYLDGPYGIFSHRRHPDAEGFVFIVGGVGITPVMSMLRTMADEGETRPLWLFYANPTIDRILFARELDGLADRLQLTLVHVIQKAGEGWTGETGYVSPEMFRRYLPEERRARLHYFLCGPPPMLAAAEEHLDRLKVARGHIHVEIFNL